MAGSTWLQR